MLKLKDVTLVLIDNITHALATKAIEDSTKYVDFADILVFSDRTLCKDAATVNFSGSGVGAAMWTLWYQVPEFVKTSHALIIQWDSWVLMAEKWSDSFLKYDYIGAVWPWHTDSKVGNGGFSLRSKKLMDVLLNDKQNYKFNGTDDDAICRKYRSKLEDTGIKFAPCEVAEGFSFERSKPHPAFGFHGMFNWPFILTDEQIEDRLAVAPPYVLESLHCKQMFEVLRAMGRKQCRVG